MPAASPFGIRQEPLQDLDLETEAPSGGAPAVPGRAKARRSANKEVSPEDLARASGKKKKQRNMAIAGLAVVGIGVGGFFGFQKWQAAKETEQELGAGVASARKHLSADAPGHWDNAAREAARAAKLDPSNAEALAIAGQAYYASVIDEGTEVEDRMARGSQFINNIRQVAAQGEEVDKAEALQSIVERRAKEAIVKLQQVTGHNAADIDGKLYLGWAYVYNHDWARAIEQFDAVIAASPTRIPALYGKGNAHLARGDAKEAREAYLAVIKQSRDKYKKDHIGALVGVAQLAEIDRFSDRENRYLEILERKDLEKEDPRAVSSAWSLAGDEALRAGRIDEAQQRYDRALALDPENLSAFVGEGKVGLRTGRLDVSRERLERVLSLDPTHIDATISLSLVALAEGRLEDAEKTINLLFERDPPLQSHEALLRAHMARGSIFEADPERATAAESEYRSAMKYAGPSEIGPTIELSKLFVKQGRGPDALAVLEPVKSAARQDPALAVSLGVAYLDTGEPVQAEEAFRMALDRRPGDVEAQYQLGIALFAQKKHDDAIDALRTAYAANESREDIGLRLARSYEQLELDKEADDLYVKLLSSRAPSINARSRAGRFYARIGNIPQAASLGELILQEQDRHPTGLYLIGEKLFAAGEFKDAQRNFRDAVRLDPQAQFLEALGRSSEKLALLEDALLDYGKAIEAEPKYLRPRLGRARIRLIRREFSEALKEYQAAQSLQPENPIIWAGIGMCQNEMRDHDQAVESLRKAISLKSVDPKVPYYLGRSYYDLDKPKEAAAAFNSATSKATGDEDWISEAYRLQGYANRSAKNSAGAIKAWKAYLDLVDPKSAQARDVQKLLMRLQAR
jgi:tetratricopeptide (TPR) repeat protein